MQTRMVRAGEPTRWWAQLAIGFFVFAFGLAQAAPAGERPSRTEAVRFLVQASYGPTEDSIAEVQRLGYQGWLEHQFDVKGISAVGRMVQHERAGGKTGGRDLQHLFWERALYGEDQLRWRMTFALSQIVVVSNKGLFQDNDTAAGYVDILQKQAFGNYCDLVHEVTYSPAMAVYLTYLKNEKANEETGFEPDENYAREIMQLFTIGLEELNIDGTPTGEPTYSNEDVSGLAAVFTGLAPMGGKFKSAKINDNNRFRPLVGYTDYHEGGRKEFLGTVINHGAYPEKSVEKALDHLLSHQNVAPFISKQLIQRFVTSNPSPDYVARVATVFNKGEYRMPDGKMVGEARRCDLKATLAAILLDPEARDAGPAGEPDFGKVREPVLRNAHFLRLIAEPRPISWEGELSDPKPLRVRGPSNPQEPFSSPSVFNFYRPGYTPSGTAAADRGLVAPEFQILTAERALEFMEWVAATVAPRRTGSFFEPRSDWLRDLARDPAAFVDYLDQTLLYGTLTETDRARMIAAIEEIKISGSRQKRMLDNRVKIGFVMAMTTPEYLVQR